MKSLTLVLLFLGAVLVTIHFLLETVIIAGCQERSNWNKKLKALMGVGH